MTAEGRRMTAEGHRGPQWFVRHIHPLVSPPPPRPVQVPHFPGIGVLISVTESPSGFKGWHRVALHVYEVLAFTCALAGLIDLLAFGSAVGRTPEGPRFARALLNMFYC